MLQKKKVIFQETQKFSVERKQTSLLPISNNNNALGKIVELTRLFYYNP